MSKHQSILTHLRLYALRLATRRRRRHLHSPVRAAGLPRRLSCQCLASSGSLLLHLLLPPPVSCCLSLPARIEDGQGQGALCRPLLQEKTRPSSALAQVWGSPVHLQSRLCQTTRFCL